MPITELEILESREAASIFWDVTDTNTAQYYASVQHRNELETHYRWKGSPGELIHRWRPNEPEDLKDYRIGSYEQITFPVGHRILLVQRGTLSNPQTYGLLMPNPIASFDRKEQFEYYIRKKTPVPGKDAESYFWEFLFPLILTDPNGYIGVMTRKGDSDPDRPVEEFRDPFPFFIPSTHILEERIDVLHSRSTLFVTVPVDGDREETRDLPIQWRFYEEGTIRLFPLEVRTNSEGEEVAVYEAQEWNVANPDDPDEEFEILVRKVGGILQPEKVFKDPKSGEIRRIQNVLDPAATAFYLSILSLTLPYFNRSARILSDLDGAIVNALFPVRTEEDTGCDDPDCDDGYYDDGTKCSTCGGSGKKTSSSGPFAGYIKQTNENGELLPSVVWSSPPTEAFTFAWEQIIESNKGALESLGMAVLDKGIGTNTTARAKEIEREQFITVIREVAAIVYPHLQWILDRMNFLRYRSLLGTEDLEANRIIVQTPTRYDISGLDETFSHLESMQTVGMPFPVREQIAESAITKQLGDDSDEGRYSLALLRIDRFSMYSEEEIAGVLASSPEPSEDLEIDKILHDNLKTIVQQLIDDAQAAGKDFLALPLLVQRDEARKKAAEIQSEGAKEREAQAAAFAASMEEPTAPEGTDPEGNAPPDPEGGGNNV